MRRIVDMAALENQGIETLIMDYTKPETIAALVDTIAARTGGRIDALFNNGAYGQPGAVEDLPVEALRQQFETNVFGWHDLTRRVIPFMRQRGSGRIVHCSSILGLVPIVIVVPIPHRNSRSRALASRCAWNFRAAASM